MEKLTSPRRGRPRATLDVPLLIEEGESAPVYVPGHGQAGRAGIEAPEQPSGKDWDSLVQALVSNKSHKTSIAMAYFPDPVEQSINTPTGWVRVTESEAGYTLNTGETVIL